MPSLTLILAVSAIVILTLTLANIASVTYQHYSRGNQFHPLPLPLHYALLVAVVEVCWDRPLALHRARMAVVHASEQRRADARADAMLRHPSNYAARQQCKANHPSALAQPRMLADTSA